MMREPVLSVQHLSVALPAGADRSHAVQEVSLALHAGETLCVVGESGSGKSVLAMSVMGLLARELRLTQGQLHLQQESLTEASARISALVEEARDGARFCELASTHGIRTHNAIKALHLDELFGSKVGR